MAFWFSTALLLFGLVLSSSSSDASASSFSPSSISASFSPSCAPASILRCGTACLRFWRHMTASVRLHRCRSGSPSSASPGSVAGTICTGPREARAALHWLTDAEKPNSGSTAVGVAAVIAFHNVAVIVVANIVDAVGAAVTLMPILWYLMKLPSYLTAQPCTLTKTYSK